MIRTTEVKLSAENYTSVPGSPSVAEDQLSMKGLDPTHLDFSAEETSSPTHRFLDFHLCPKVTYAVYYLYTILYHELPPEDGGSNHVTIY